MELILASTSTYRQQLLSRLQVPFRALPPTCSEDELKRVWADLSPHDLALRLAEAKAESLRACHPEAWIVGSDQLLALGDEVLGKANTQALCLEKLLRLGGRTHELVTALVLCSPKGETHRHLEVAHIKLRKLSEEDLRRYMHREPALDCAGGYKLEGLGISLVERLDCGDPTALIGLPLMALSACLRSEGFELP